MTSFYVATDNRRSLQVVGAVRGQDWLTPFLDFGSIPQCWCLTAVSTEDAVCARWLWS